MKTLTHPLNVASDISELVYMSTDNANYSNTTTLINEFGEVGFECEIEVTHDYYGGDSSVGEAYEFDVTGVTVSVINVFDEDGDTIAVNKYDIVKIEKLLEQNLTFEITKKY